MSVTSRILAVYSLPTISNRTFRDDDRNVAHVDIAVQGCDPISWWTIVHRQGTDEYFKVYSWDGSGTCYEPGIPCADLPEGVVIKKRVA